MISYVDAFSGIGGFHLGVERALGGQAGCVMAIDHDPKAASTYHRNFGISSLADIRKVEGREIPDHEVLFGGFPCQPFSKNGRWFLKNGKTVGDSEDRDNLFLELVRILYAKRPDYFVFENVSGLTLMRNKDGTSVLDTIVQNLKQAGYSVHYRVLDAADFGVPQQRKRIFFVGIREGLRDMFGWPVPSYSVHPAIQDILQPNLGDPKYLLKNLWRNRTVLLGARPGAHQANHPFHRGTPRYDAIEWLYDTNQGKPRTRTGQIEPVAILYGDTPSGLPRQQDKVYSVLGISPTVPTFSTPAVDAPEGLRMLTPRECARLQGFPDSYELPASDAVAYKQIGNSVCVPVVAAVVSALFF
jgi:DNA (cytosine-5)-methyltransferase 1